MSNYSTKDVIFNNLNVTTNPITNNTPKIAQNYQIKLAQGQTITYARVFASIVISPTSPNVLGVGAKLYLNGNLLQTFSFDPFDLTQKTYQQNITNIIVSNNLNSFEWDFDGSLQDVTFIVYADVFYSLNTSTPPISSGNKGNPTTSLLATIQQFETPILIGVGAVTAIWILSKIFK